ncbi:MAG: hypothetical protein RJA63_307, partial [Pseudomonadota bacterium]
MQYEVRALSGDTIQSLLVDAISDEDAARVVSERQLTAISIKRIKNGAGWLAPRGSRFDLVLFSIELMELLDAGLGVVEAVDALSARQRDSETTRVFARLLERLRVGVSFSAALAQSADLFPPIYIGLVRAAERTSDLKGALGRYLEYRSRFDALRARVVSALIYPVILLCVGSAVTLFLMVWVMPRFSAVFDTSGHNMPILSRLLIDWGHLVSQYRLELTSSVVALIAALFVISYRAFHTGSAETLLVFFPALQERVNTFRISRLYLTLGTLLNGGMPALQALEMAEGVLPKAMLPRLQQVA